LPVILARIFAAELHKTVFDAPHRIGQLNPNGAEIVPQGREADCTPVLADIEEPIKDKNDKRAEQGCEKRVAQEMASLNYPQERTANAYGHGAGDKKPAPVGECMPKQRDQNDHYRCNCGALTGDEGAIPLAFVGEQERGRKLCRTAKFLNLRRPCPTPVVFQNYIHQKSWPKQKNGADETPDFRGNFCIAPNAEIEKEHGNGNTEQQDEQQLVKIPQKTQGRICRKRKAAIGGGKQPCDPQINLWKACKYSCREEQPHNVAHVNCRFL